MFPFRARCPCGTRVVLVGIGPCTRLGAMAGTGGTPEPTPGLAPDLARGLAIGARVPLPVLGGPPPEPRPTIPECYGDVCITCSDEAIPVTIVELLDDDLASVDTGQSLEVVSVALVDAEVGDTILVHAKEAIAVVRAEAN